MTQKRIQTLPPLILHPFSDPDGPSKLVESSRASMMLQGVIPSGGLSPEELDQSLLDGRYCEIRMLFYVGRDLVRWIEQCLEHVEHNPELKTQNLRFQSFAQFLIDDPPATVKEKLKRWGVADYRSIFARALGLNVVFNEPPPQETLAPSFLRSYYRYADQMFAVQQHMAVFGKVTSDEFDFELFASGEYSRMLAQGWE